MSSSVRSVFFSPRPLRSLVATTRTRRSYATIPTKNPNPTPPLEPSQEQAMPLGRFYEAILNTPQPIPDVKPEEPATSVKEAQQEAAPKRGRKPKEAKAKTEPASTATASTAPSASPATDQKRTAEEAAAKSPASSSAKSSPPPSVSTSPPVPTPPPTTTSTQDKAKVIFGSRLAGPAERAERLAAIRSKSKVVAGVVVPPRPEEPDNCCMSGCVNCVWDRFRDEMEEWVLSNAEANRRLMTERADASVEGSGVVANSSAPPPPPSVDHTAVSMDDDGGGSDTNWDVGTAGPDPEKLAKNLWDDELYKNVPVGIREFMKQEKRLKQKHLREGTSGG